MNKSSLAPKNHPQRLLAALVATSGVATLLGWGLKARSSAPPLPLPPTALLATLPELPKNAPNATQRELQKWKRKAQESPDNPTHWLNLGDTLMQRARETAEHQYYDWAERAYRQTLTLAPQKSDAMTGLAWVAGGKHQFPQSIAWAQKAIALNPQDSSAYGLIGDAQTELGEYKAALVSYQKMLDIRPDLSSYSRGAQLLYLLGDTRKGMWLMTKAIKAGGEHAENTAWCQAKLAEMLQGEGAILPAENLLSEAQKTFPESPPILNGLAKVKAARKLYPEAITLYEKALALAPQPTGLAALGDLYLATNQPQKAEQTFVLVEKLYETHQKQGNTDTLSLARFWADHDRQLPRALEIAQAHQDTKNAAQLDTIAWCFYKNGKLTEAKAVIDRAVHATDPTPTVLFHAGMIYAKSGKNSQAQRYLQQALSRNPYFSVLEARTAEETLTTLGSKPTR